MNHSLLPPPRYRIEVSPPKQTANDLTLRLDRFAERYLRVVEAGHCVCITDNAMGHLAFQGNELLQELALPVRPRQVMIHLNTFHSLRDLHWILDSAASLGITDILIISGDGSTRLPKLAPGEVGCTTASVTSVELLQYIHRTYPGVFTLGAAFNQYEPPVHEMEKLKRKIDAGAGFIITQPCLGRNASLEELMTWLPVPLIIEAWMSVKIQLLTDCIGYDVGVGGDFDPVAVLDALQGYFPSCGFYLALLDFKRQFDGIGTTKSVNSGTPAGKEGIR